MNALGLRAHREETLDVALLLLLFFQLVLLEFFGLASLLNKVVTVLLLVRMAIRPGKLQIGITVLLVARLILYCISAALSEELILNNVISNFLIQFYPLVYAGFLLYLHNNDPRAISVFLDRGFWLFNATLLINFPVLFLQILRPYSLVAVGTARDLAIYEDAISGLFAPYGTHLVCLFTVFVVLYDLGYSKRRLTGARKTCFWLYIAFIVLVSLFIALNNDNKAMLILLPVALFTYWFADGGYLSSRKLRILLWLAVIAFLLIVFGYGFVPTVRRLMDKYIVKFLKVISSSVSMGNTANGSGERIAILAYAAKMPSTWLAGTGFGSSFLFQANYHGFRHFGQGDLGSFLILGGLWYTILSFAYYFTIARRLMHGHRKKSNLILSVGFFLLLSCIMLYTQAFTRADFMLGVMLIVLAYRYANTAQAAI